MTFGRPFTVREGQTTVVTIDFDGQRSVHLNGEGDYILTPEVKLLVDEPLVNELLKEGEDSSPRHDHPSGKKLEIEGLIESFSATELVVGGLTITITPETEMDGFPTEGLYVDVEVVVEADGSFTAVELEVKGERGSGLPKVEIEGTIEALNGDTWTVAGYTVRLTGEATWQAGGQTVTVATNAEIDGDPQVGHTAEVKGLLGPDGTLLALEIEVDDDGEDDEGREERAHGELNGVIEGLYGTRGDISSLSEQDLEGQNWRGDMTVTLADGTTFTINRGTEIEGTLRSGVEVEVKIETASDGARYAIEIEVEDHEKEREEEVASENQENPEEEREETNDHSGSGTHGGDEEEASGTRDGREEEPVLTGDGGEVKQEVRLTNPDGLEDPSGKAKYEFREGDRTRVCPAYRR